MSFKPDHGRVLRMTAAVYSDVVRDALGRDGRSNKQLARDLGVVPRAVEGWRSGDSLPSVPNFIKLCLAIPELRAAALEWLEAERAIDPDTERLLMDLQRTALQHMQRKQQRIEEEGAT